MQQVKTKLLGSSFYRQKLKDEQINTLSRKLSSVSEVVRMVRSSTSNDTVAVRLVLTEMNKSATHRAIRKLVSPVASQTSLFPQFGMVSVCYYSFNVWLTKLSASVSYLCHHWIHDVRLE